MIISKDLQIKELYEQGLSIAQISKLLNKTSSHIGHRLRKNKVVLRNRLDALNKVVKIYNVNEDYFSVIDTEEKAYFLGYLYADGNIEQGSKRFQLSLHVKDLKILEKFKQSLLFTGPLRHIVNKNMVSLRVYSLKMCKDLKNLGVVPNKGRILVFPNLDQVPVLYLNHFIRGYFDGDGHVRKRKNSSFSILGTLDFYKVV